MQPNSQAEKTVASIQDAQHASWLKRQNSGRTSSLDSALHATPTYHSESSPGKMVSPFSDAQHASKPLLLNERCETVKLIGNNNNRNPVTWLQAMRIKYHEEDLMQDSIMQAYRDQQAFGMTRTITVNIKKSHPQDGQTTKPSGEDNSRICDFD